MKLRQRWHIYLCFIALFSVLTTSCKERLLTVAPPMTSDEFQIIRAAIKGVLGSDFGNVNAVVLSKTTLGHHVEDDYKKAFARLREDAHIYSEKHLAWWLSDYSAKGIADFSDVSPFGLEEAVKDLVRKNTANSRMIIPSTAAEEISFMSNAEFKEIFTKTDGWEVFKAKHPNSMLVKVSRVGISNDGRIATLYLSETWGPLAGNGCFYILAKSGEEWLFLPLTYGPSWVS